MLRQFKAMLFISSRTPARILSVTCIWLYYLIIYNILFSYIIFTHYVLKLKNDWNNNNYFIYQFMCMLLLFVCQEVLKQETTRNNNNTVKSFWRTEDCKRNTDFTTFNISMAYNLCKVSIYFSLQKLLPVYKNALLFFHCEMIWSARIWQTSLFVS